MLFTSDQHAGATWMPRCAASLISRPLDNQVAELKIHPWWMLPKTTAILFWKGNSMDAVTTR
jgi:hypothetical protein